MKKFKLFVDLLFILTVIYMCVWIKPDVNNTIQINQNLNKGKIPGVIENQVVNNQIA